MSDTQFDNAVDALEELDKRFPGGEFMTTQIHSLTSNDSIDTTRSELQASIRVESTGSEMWRMRGSQPLVQPKGEFDDVPHSMRRQSRHFGTGKDWNL